MKKMLAFIVAAVALVTINNVGVSAATGESIQRFDSQVAVTRDNTVKTTETIVYNFGTNSRHGIYRDIPIDYRDGSDTYYVNFKLVGVWDEYNKPVQTELSTENGNKRIRIGDPDRTITGIHTYKISYELSPLIIERDGKPFLNLDIIGEGWEVPINNISAKITVENGANLSNIEWFGATNLSPDNTELIVLFVGPYRGITVNAELPEGYVTNYLEPNKLRTEDVIAMLINIAIATVVVVSIVGVLIILIVRTIRSRARRKKQIVVAQYEPPESLSPAHIGLLQDDVAAGREITATIIDWAKRGYLKIVYIPKKGFFGSKDYQLVKLKDSTSLPHWESPLFNAIFKENEMLLSRLDKVAVASQSTAFKAAIKKQLTDKGYYDKGDNILMHGTITEEGAKQWALVDGFKLYLSVVEKDRLKFSDAPEKTPERFNALLPYAIALGVEKQWAKQFEGIDLSQTTTWYSGNMAAFSAVALTSDLSSSFAATVSSNSSVSSSGGSSGGGFGGGGGGSW
jgi:uncharacterized membrane protein